MNDQGHGNGCGCQGCMALDQGGQQDVADGTGLVLISGSGDFDPTSIIYGDGWHSNASQIGTGVNLSYSFTTYVPDYVPSGDRAGFRAFDEALQVRAESAMDMVEQYTLVEFNEVNQADDDIITWNILETGQGVAGYAYLPTTLAHGTNGLSGDIFLDDDYYSTPESYAEGTAQNKTVMHELGHALGLEHLHTNISDSPELRAVDNRTYSVMSYTASPSGLEPSSFMVLDIAALQHLYGVDYAHNAGHDNYDLGVSGEYWNKLFAIWDGGGRDTLDAQSADASVMLSLVEGSYSSVGNNENFGIAYGAVIENARGGRYDDTLIGNDVTNQLFGNKGADEIYGAGGNDYLNGGQDNDVLHGDEGHDRLYGEDGDDHLMGGDGHDTLVGGEGSDILDGGNGVDRVSYLREQSVHVDLFNQASNAGAAVGDQFISIESVEGSKQDDVILGDGNDNKFAGQDGDDYLDGRDGNDVFFGQAGDDTAIGGEGDDRYFYSFGSDSFDGGAGIDALDFHIAQMAVWASLEDGEMSAYRLDEDGSVQEKLVEVSNVENIYGSKYNDVIYGGDGDNKLLGRNGDDFLYGLNGDDQLQGGNGNDVLNGGAGDDSLFGGRGSDRLVGGEGVDRLYGQHDADEFYLNVGTLDNSAADIIMDFSQSQGDTIILDGLLELFDDITDAIADFVSVTSRGSYSYISVDLDGAGTTHEAQEVFAVNGTANQWSDVNDLIAQGDLDIV